MEVWLVTGADRGLGRNITEAVLKASGIAVAGVRRPDTPAPLRARHDEQLLPVEPDVRDENAAQTAVRRAMKACGCVDVLVYNAKYQFNGPSEQITSEQFRDGVETCLFGVVHITRATLPFMRQQRHGHIFQVSSIGGRVAIPGNSP